MASFEGDRHVIDKSDVMSSNKRLLIACTGSVASIKLHLIIDKVKKLFPNVSLSTKYER